MPVSPLRKNHRRCLLSRFFDPLVLLPCGWRRVKRRRDCGGSVLFDVFRRRCRASASRRHRHRRWHGLAAVERVAAGPVMCTAYRICCMGLGACRGWRQRIRHTNVSADSADRKHAPGWGWARRRLRLAGVGAGVVDTGPLHPAQWGCGSSTMLGAGVGAGEQAAGRAPPVPSTCTWTTFREYRPRGVRKGTNDKLK